MCPIGLNEGNGASRRKKSGLISQTDREDISDGYSTRRLRGLTADGIVITGADYSSTMWVPICRAYGLVVAPLAAHAGLALFRLQVRLHVFASDLDGSGFIIRNSYLCKFPHVPNSAHRYIHQLRETTSLGLLTLVRGYLMP